MIYDYIAQDSPKYADRMMDKIIGRVDVLINFPELGKKVLEFDDENIRELIEGGYRIIYRLDESTDVGIARIHHSSKILKSI